MSTHARLGAESGLKVLEDHLVSLICDLFCRESKASSQALARPVSSPAPATITSRPVLLRYRRGRWKRLAICASRPCRSGHKCFHAGSVTGMAAATVTSRRSVRADGQGLLGVRSRRRRRRRRRRSTRLGLRRLRLRVLRTRLTAERRCARQPCFR